ncbi:hypothetical protein GCM10009734_01940 [Nonomuraea bangladeshensis]
MVRRGRSRERWRRGRVWRGGCARPAAGADLAPRDLPLRPAAVSPMTFVPAVPISVVLIGPWLVARVCDLPSGKSMDGRSDGSQEVGEAAGAVGPPGGGVRWVYDPARSMTGT